MDKHYDFSESAEIPHISEASRGMLLALDEGGALALWEEICNSAIGKYWGSNERANAAMSKVVNDMNGERRMLQLLISMPTDLIRALILNTVGMKYKSCRDFRKMIAKIGGEAGIYVNTLIRDDQGRWLTRKELEAYRSMVSRYMECREGDQEAYEIDTILNSSNAADVDTMAGERLWMNKNGALE
jgi:hypothetical protein